MWGNRQGSSLWLFCSLHSRECTWQNVWSFNINGSDTAEQRMPNTFLISFEFWWSLLLL